MSACVHARKKKKKKKKKKKQKRGERRKHRTHAARVQPIVEEPAFLASKRDATFLAWPDMGAPGTLALEKERERERKGGARERERERERERSGGPRLLTDRLTD